MSRLYMRVCEMNVAGRVLSYPPITLEFETTFSENAPSQTKAKIYNPAPETVAACEKHGSAFPRILIKAGYQDDNGTCVTGDIIKYELKPGKDRVLDLTIADRSSPWTAAVVNRSWQGTITARDAARQVLADLGITPADMVFGDEKVYSNGLSFSGVPLRTAMERIARDTRSRFTFRNGQASFLTDQAGSGMAFVLGYDTGLLDASPTTAGYKVKALFLYKLQAGSLVRLNKPGEVTTLRVKNGKHQFSSSGSNSGTEFEARRV